jgi:hypothetical protein
VMPRTASLHDQDAAMVAGHGMPCPWYGMTCQVSWSFVFQSSYWVLYLGLWHGGGDGRASRVRDDGSPWYARV